MEIKTKITQIVDEAFISQIQNNLIKQGFRSLTLNSEKEVKDFINNNIPD